MEQLQERVNSVRYAFFQAHLIQGFWILQMGHLLDLLYILDDILPHVMLLAPLREVVYHLAEGHGEVDKILHGFQLGLHDALSDIPDDVSEASICRIGGEGVAKFLEGQHLVWVHFPRGGCVLVRIEEGGNVVRGKAVNASNFEDPDHVLHLNDPSFSSLKGLISPFR